MNRRRFGVFLGLAMLGSAASQVFAADHDHRGGADEEHGHGPEHGRDFEDRDSDRHDFDGHDHAPRRHANDEHAIHDHGTHAHMHGYGDHRGGTYFRLEDYRPLARYYDGPRTLPPGLRHHYYRTGQLPPGWQRKFRPLPAVVVAQLPPVPVGYQRGYMDGYAVVIDPRTRVILDAVDIVAVLAHH